MLAILQARCSSKRLPRKVLSRVNGKPIILWQLERILQSKEISRVIVATSDDASDDELVDLLDDRGFEVSRGNLNNVLERFIRVINEQGIDSFVRLTADCPLFMPAIADKLIGKFHELQVDYLSNTITPTFPDGCDVEVVKSEKLFQLFGSQPSEAELEHVTLGLYKRNEFAVCVNIENDQNESNYRWTLDTHEDLDFVRAVYENMLGRESTFGYSDVMDLIRVGAVRENMAIR
jgi:spore coat polysaccharide biosynthesis protein SpsF